MPMAVLQRLEAVLWLQSRVLGILTDEVFNAFHQSHPQRRNGLVPGLQTEVTGDQQGLVLLLEIDGPRLYTGTGMQ